MEGFGLIWVCNYVSFKMAIVSGIYYRTIIYVERTSFVAISSATAIIASLPFWEALANVRRAEAYWGPSQ